jgi:hypothetical protein
MARFSCAEQGATTATRITQPIRSSLTAPAIVLLSEGASAAETLGKRRPLLFEQIIDLLLQPGQILFERSTTRC